MLPQLIKSKPTSKPSDKTAIERLLQKRPMPSGLPEFPKFKPLELSDKSAIEAITSKYAPYSDFNFTSMWCWDVQGDMRVSTLNGNLVVKFNDYTTGKPFYSFLGDSHVTDTVQKLLELSVQEGIEPALKLIPEEVVTHLDQQKFTIQEDRDNFDYIYSIEKLVALSGSEYATCRKSINHFTKRNKNILTRDLDLTLIENRVEVVKIYDCWKKNKRINLNAKNEDSALMRLIGNIDHLPLINIGVFVENKLVALTLNGTPYDQYSTSHFAMFDIQYDGAYSYSMKITAERLRQEGSIYINCEQDLGLPGLRSSKQSLRPVSYLKKYILENKDSTY